MSPADFGAAQLRTLTHRCGASRCPQVKQAGLRQPSWVQCKNFTGQPQVGWQIGYAGRRTQAEGAARYRPNNHGGEQEDRSGAAENADCAQATEHCGPSGGVLSVRTWPAGPALRRRAVVNGTMYVYGPGLKLASLRMVSVGNLLRFSIGITGGLSDPAICLEWPQRARSR